LAFRSARHGSCHAGMGSRGKAGWRASGLRSGRLRSESAAVARWRGQGVLGGLLATRALLLHPVLTGMRQRSLVLHHLAEGPHVEHAAAVGTLHEMIGFARGLATNPPADVFAAGDRAALVAGKRGVTTRITELHWNGDSRFAAPIRSLEHLRAPAVESRLLRGVAL
jgi:hypothetical protein